MEMHALFETPLFVFRPSGLEALDDWISVELVRESDRDPGLRPFNHGGWHSRPDLAERENTAFRKLAEVKREAAWRALTWVAESRQVALPGDLSMTIEAWGVVMRHGDYVAVHDHTAAHFSTLYYPDAGESTSSSGSVTFVDGRRGRVSIPGTELGGGAFDLCPESGMLLVFPGWLQHFVHPYLGECPRVSVASNVWFGRPGRVGEHPELQTQHGVYQGSRSERLGQVGFEAQDPKVVGDVVVGMAAAGDRPDRGVVRD